MLRPGAWNDVQAQPGVEADKAAAVAHGQAQQVAVGNLPVTQQVLPGVIVVGVQLIAEIWF